MTTEKILVLFATETGNSEELANRTVETAQDKGFDSEAISVEEVSIDDLGGEPCLLFIGSTQGEGEPPEPAWDFHDALKDAEGTPLDGVPYTILALGDRSYGDLYCAFGKYVDKHFTRLGGKSFMPITFLDEDFDEDYEAWSEKLFATVTKG